MKTEAPATARILLVDNNARGQIARKLILLDHGYSVETAQSGEDAWELFQKDRFDVVVTDYRMKGMDGLELIRRIRESGSPARTILLSNHLLELTAESDADEQVAKSAKEIPELLRTIRRLAARPRRRGVTSARRSAEPPQKARIG